MLLLRRRNHVEISCPAKLNLFLEIHGRRTDGFHELETLMVPINIFDTLNFSANDSGDIRLTSRYAYGSWSNQFPENAETTDRENGLPSGMENIVTKAATLFRTRFGIMQGVDIRLLKRIPSAAGLGGASSDAVAALIGCARVWQQPVSTDELLEMSAELGSDVPFFVHCRPAVCRGRGEKVQTTNQQLQHHFVLVKPPVGLPTPHVFKHCEVPATPKQFVAETNQANTQFNPRLMFNRLQDAAKKVTPWIGRLESTFQQLGLVAHQMSGSGSTYFGICHSRHQAIQAANRLRAARLGNVFTAETYRSFSTT